MIRTAMALALLASPLAAAAAEECTDTSGSIEVDRPDVTNSSLVVPSGSVQVENGVNLTDDRAAKLVDGSNSRLRLSLGHCNEFLVDLPDYTARVAGTAASGFSDLVPAFKHQLGPLAGGFDLSATAGVALPTGAAAVAGRGAQPYLQFPWSRDLDRGWQLSGMFTATWAPVDAAQHVLLQPTFVVEHELPGDADAFIEYVGNYVPGHRSAQLVNSGAAWRVTRLQQLDFHLAFGLDTVAPRYEFGIGYSIRFDQVW